MTFFAPICRLTGSRTDFGVLWDFMNVKNPYKVEAIIMLALFLGLPLFRFLLVFVIGLQYILVVQRDPTVAGGHK